MVITIILNIVFSFGTAFLFALLFNSPKYLLTPAGIVGAIGWIAFQTGMMVNGSDVQSSFIGSLFIGVAGHMMSRKFFSPVILFIIPGIIPLVPGGTAYEAIKNLVLNDYHEALITMIKVALISSSIALGLLIADLLSKVYYKYKKHRQLNKVK
ncbi:threonine/serine exporter family protein [Mammaliicoccus sciuri]|uniref:threonine/serine exporter family protein n=1 Tax=Mammaliicoccus sciuri TaxID=1296 RepID=UPI002DB8A6C8|nr:threonine/serine exporter family protein [Mammaliicoccus sciuri]MEB8072046.1 threonine/serine exporter family protein [Mammaliicoccus sciuri]